MNMDKPFSKILIANRGEIAVRIIRACREMGIATVAVYSEADRKALHVRLADQAVELGPSASAQSYLSIEKILDAARQTRADAIHPGYGFLSENAAFARAVEAAGLAFIGPPAEAIHLMGDKAEARTRVQAFDVPVTPGYQGPDDLEAFVAVAQEIGYPILLKASAGGGGKGMRVVWKEAGLKESSEAARREAVHAFGDGHLILEKYIPNAHHIEFQVLGDRHGTLLHLFERECSIQRRHQKIIEETPSPLMDAALREEMGAAAVNAARSAGYTNAGTVEFILDPDTRRYYFLEMNTRLQVEHPITELITGLDLVQWQIRIAAGEKLPFKQADLHARGHAIECRLYAEDPASGFLPSSGPLLRLVEPQGPGVRVDSGYVSGDDITVNYDPLIAKIIVRGEDRPSAIRRMQMALQETVVLGVTTNNRFLQDVLAHPDFQAGKAHTTWVEKIFEGWQAPACLLPPEVLAAAALSQFSAEPSHPSAGTDLSADPYSPWTASSGFRTGEGG
jgi:acetyl-CoA carboxylase biotin carboxylase subunit